MLERISNNQWTTIIVVVNVLFIAGIILLALHYNIEKSIMVYWILYPIILFGNLFVWLVVRAFSPKISRRWVIIMIIMLIAYLPLATLIEKTAI